MKRHLKFSQTLNAAIWQFLLSYVYVFLGRFGKSANIFLQRTINTSNYCISPQKASSFYSVQNYFLCYKMQVLNLHDQLNDWSCLMSGGLPRSKPIQYSSDSGGQICVKKCVWSLLEVVEVELLPKVRLLSNQSEAEDPAAAQIYRRNQVFLRLSSFQLQRRQSGRLCLLSFKGSLIK